MKNRRSIIVAFMLCAIMIMGVGFAAISGELSITGNLSSTPEAFAVIFTDAVKTEGTTDGVTVNFETTEESLSNVSLRAVSVGISNLSSDSDQAEVKFTIKNNNEVTMYCKANLDVSKATGFDIAWDSAWDSVVAIEAGETTTMTITVSLSGAITDALNGSFAVKIDSSSDSNAL